jgi:hypothetical protein
MATYLAASSRPAVLEQAPKMKLTSAYVGTFIVLEYERQVQ